MKKKSFFKVISLSIFAGLIFSFYYIFSLITATPIILFNKTGRAVCVHSATLGNYVGIQNTPIENGDAAIFSRAFGDSERFSISYSKNDNDCELSENLIESSCRIPINNADVCYVFISKSFLACSECYQ